MGQKKGFRSVLIISISISVTVAMAAIWFSPVVESSNQTQLSTSPAISMNAATVDGRDYVNNTIWNFLAAESQVNGQSAQYKLDSAFINWYVSNVNALPGNSRNLTQQNISSLFQNFLFSGYNAHNLVEDAVNSEPVVTSSVATSSGTASPDPYVMETETTIYAPILFWSVVWEIKFDNFLKFSNQQNALNFENFLISDLTGEAIYNDIFTGFFFILVGAAPVETAAQFIYSLIIGVASTAVGDVAGTTSPASVANSVSTLYGNQEATYHHFEIVYELDEYPYLATQAYSVYGPVIGGSINLFGTVNPLDIFGTTQLNDYVEAFSDFANQYGLNNWVYYSAPPSWTEYFGYD